jgi:hypothetical protein
VGKDFQLRAEPARDPYVIARGGAAMFERARGSGRGRRATGCVPVAVPSGTAALSPDDRAWIAVRHLAATAIVGGVLQTRDVVAYVLRLCGVPAGEIAAHIGLGRRAAEKRIAAAARIFDAGAAA